jgi:hypothetical protein
VFIAVDAIGPVPTTCGTAMLLPFRLTRLLRENTDSLLSLFSVFVRDPQWQASVPGAAAVEQVKATLTPPVPAEAQVDQASLAKMFSGRAPWL